MTALRRNLTLVLLLPGVLVLPACQLALRSSSSSENVESVALPPPAGTQFADLIRTPGERVAVHEPNPIVETRHQVTESPVVVQEPLPQLAVPPATTPTPVPDPPLVAVVRAYLENHPERAVEHLKSFSKANQDLLLQLIPATVQASQINLTTGSTREIGVLAEQLQQPAKDLANKGPLWLDKVCFCRDVENFGRYDPLPEGASIRPGQLALLYVEVRNVPSVLTQLPDGGKGYVTDLVCSLQVHDATGAVVEIPNPDKKLVPMLVVPKKDIRRSQVHDYFLRFWFSAPLRPGLYSVSIEVRDPATGRVVGRPSIPMRVGG